VVVVVVAANGKTDIGAGSIRVIMPIERALITNAGMAVVTTSVPAIGVYCGRQGQCSDDTKEDK
jgi:hypothetical protein